MTDVQGSLIVGRLLVDGDNDGLRTDLLTLGQRLAVRFDVTASVELYQSGPSAASAMRVNGKLEALLTIIVVDVVVAARCMASSPSGWRSRCRDVGASMIGLGMGRPKSSVDVSTVLGSTPPPPISCTQSNASRLRYSVNSDSVPWAV